MNENTQRFIIAMCLIVMLGYMVFIGKIGAEYFMGLITGVVGFYFTDSIITKDKNGKDGDKTID